MTIQIRRFKVNRPLETLLFMKNLADNMAFYQVDIFQQWLLQTT